MNRRSLPAGVASNHLGLLAALIALVIPRVQAAISKPEPAVRLSGLMQRYLDNGRSTPGAPQKTAVPVSLKGGRRQTQAVASDEPK